MPQGSLLEQKTKGRAKVKIAVFFVLAIHAIGLLALLMQGCRRDDNKTTATDTNTNTIVTQPFDNTNAAPVVDTSAIAAVPAIPTNAAQTDVTIPAAAPIEYTIVQGDSFSKLSTRFHVGVNALMAANPGVEPTKLRPGQKIKIPPPAPVATTTTTTTVAPANGEIYYAVKSGDTLSKIAENFKTSVKAIRAANNLKTDSIRVGQKLTIPKSNGAAPETAATNISTPAPK
jgi:LysM repeat protein